MLECALVLLLLREEKSELRDLRGGGSASEWVFRFRFVLGDGRLGLDTVIWLMVRGWLSRSQMLLPRLGGCEDAAEEVTVSSELCRISILNHSRSDRFSSRGPFCGIP